MTTEPTTPVTFPTITQGDQQLVACPNCGSADDWRAWYTVPESQDVTLYVADDGTTGVDYAGNTRTANADGGDDSYACGNCGTEYGAELLP